ncbi:MAG: hypothetical protein WCT14_11935, partial [Treponemataceae bacterium]
DAAAAGEIAADADPASSAFCLDDIFLAVQFSYASTYYRNRLRHYVGDAAVDDPEILIAAAMRFIRRAMEIRR